MKNLASKSRVLIVFIFFLTAYSNINAQQYESLVKERLALEVEKNKLPQGDISDWIISDQYTDRGTGLTHVYIQQRFSGILVYNAISVFAIKDGKVLYFKSGLIDHLENKVKAKVASISSEDAIRFALRHLEIYESLPFRLISSDASKNEFVYDAKSVSNSPVKVTLVYSPAERGVILSWNVSIEMKNEPHWWNVRVDANTGAYLDKNDFVTNCSFGDATNELLDQSFSESNSSGGLNRTTGIPTVANDYNVFPYPIEAPSFGSRSLVSNPANPIASPYGWHDLDGSIGAEHTITRGNNAYAYEDADADNVPGYSPDGGPSLHFDFPFANNVAPITNQDASLTNLFYAVNTIHDYMYQFGFTEEAGNFQDNNYGNGGSETDHVNAEGLDGGGVSNANFFTPIDGQPGRMQMFLWKPPVITTVIINTPASIAGNYSGLAALFGPTITSAITADLVLVNDGNGVFTDACEPLVNSGALAGKIAVIDRGTCQFVDKVISAQDAGAVAVIIINNTPGVVSMGGNGFGVTIPSQMISQSDGNIIKTKLNNNIVVNATLNPYPPIGNDLDGSFDNGIIAHEYCHGISNRLTGGPSQSGCLGNDENGGEGWSDWLSLIMTIKNGDVGTTSRGVGTYVYDQPTNGLGTRRYPYSTNMGINPLTYSDLASNPEIHAIGEIWCSVIWDMSWLLMDQFGYNSNPSASAAGNNIAIRLILEGMKLQPCQPGFLDSRNAILLADEILYSNAHRCLIWEAFAKRGMGVNADQGSPDIAGDETADFQVPSACLSCASCSTTIVVNSNVTFNFNTPSPSYSGPSALIPFVSYTKIGTIPSAWKANINMGSNKLLIQNGVTIKTLQVNGYAPGIVIKGDCEIELEPLGKIIVSSTNKDAGELSVQMKGNIFINGELRNEVTGTNGLPGCLTVASDCGSIYVSKTGLIQDLGLAAGACGINLLACGSDIKFPGSGNINVSGLVKAYAIASSGNQSLNRPNIKAVSLNGSITVNANSAEPLYDEFSNSGTLYDIYGGFLSWVRDNANPGKVEVQAKNNITVNGHGTDPTGPVRKSFGAIAAIATASNSPGGLVDIRALEGNIIANNRSFDVSGRNRLATNFAQIKLYSKNNISLTRSGPNNNYGPVMDATSPAAGGRGGTNDLRSFSGTIFIEANAQILSSVPAGSGSVQGINLLKACSAVVNNGVITPADLVPGDNSGACSPSNPAAIVSSCSTLVGPFRLGEEDQGLAEEISNEFAVYPNPSDGKINLRFNSNSSEIFTVTVIDLTGRIMISEKIDAIEGNNDHELDLRFVSKGIYLLILENEDTREQKRVIVQ